jgi:lincosamide and streptogramin A transport system ATP-binding/permease protein
MSSIIFNSVTFYHNISKKLFRDLSLSLDTSWRLGVIGRNGRGKTTLFNLIRGLHAPIEGSIHSTVEPFYFPYIPGSPLLNTSEIIKEAVAPFKKMERRMEELLRHSDEESLNRYSALLDEYTQNNGYGIDSLIEKEAAALGMDTNLLHKPFNLLSGGEQTRALLIPLFLKKNAFPLIDEPTNHLDMEGREMLGNYLSRQKGFMLISHDRYFLDLCIDHVLSINRNEVRINKGDYSTWRYNMDIEEEFERRKTENIKREVKSLEGAAAKRRKWSGIKEKEKSGAYDKGFIGHRSAKLMKRAISIENRINEKLEEKKSLLLNTERERKLRLNTGNMKGERVLSMENIMIRFGDREIIKGFSMQVHKGDRVALMGNNGSGKTSILKVITGEIIPAEGGMHIPAYAKISYAPQKPVWVKGLLREHLASEKLDETIFRTIMGTVGAEGEIFERPLETFSMGELKKVSLCKSFMEEYDLFIWDEPLNYLDVMSREQIENVILEYEPTIIFTEHDRKFIESVATELIALQEDGRIMRWFR